MTSPLILCGTPWNDPDLVYLSGFRTRLPVILVHSEHGKVLLVSEADHQRASLQFADGEVIAMPIYLYDSLRSQADLDKWLPGAGEILAAIVGSHAQVSLDFPMALADALGRAGVQLIPRARPLASQRAVKSPDEVKQIRRVAAVAAAALQAVADFLRQVRIDGSRALLAAGEPVTGALLEALIQRILVEGRCTTDGVLIAQRGLERDPHSHCRGPLVADFPIVVDIFPRCLDSWYFADLATTFVKGTPAPAVDAMIAAVDAARAEAHALLAPGVDGATIHRRVSTLFAEQGFPPVFQDGLTRGFLHGTAHGVGLEIHELPAISRFASLLSKGNVVAVEPSLVDERYGAVRFEEMFLVDQTPLELAPLPLERVIP